MYRSPFQQNLAPWPIQKPTGAIMPRPPAIMATGRPVFTPYSGGAYRSSAPAATPAPAAGPPAGAAPIPPRSPDQTPWLKKWKDDGEGGWDKVWVKNPLYPVPEFVKKWQTDGEGGWNPVWAKNPDYVRPEKHPVGGPQLGTRPAGSGSGGANTPGAGAAGYFFTPFSNTSWGRRWKDAQGKWHITLGAQAPGEGAKYLDPSWVPDKWKMPGFDGSPPKDADGKPINPRDAAYFLNASGLRYKMDNQLTALQKVMDELRHRDPNGKTQFDLLNEGRLDQWRQKKDGTYSDLAQRGFYNSGMRGKTAAQLAYENAQGMDALNRQYGMKAQNKVLEGMDTVRHDVGNEMLQYLLSAMTAKKQLGLTETLGG